MLLRCRWRSQRVAAAHEAHRPSTTAGERARRGRVASCGTLPGSPNPLVQQLPKVRLRRRRRKRRRHWQTRMKLVDAETTTALPRLPAIPPLNACRTTTFPVAARAVDVRKTTHTVTRRAHLIFLCAYFLASSLPLFLPSLAFPLSCCLKYIPVSYLCCVRPSCNVRPVWPSAAVRGRSPALLSRRRGIGSCASKQKETKRVLPQEAIESFLARHFLSVARSGSRFSAPGSLSAVDLGRRRRRNQWASTAAPKEHQSQSQSERKRRALLEPGVAWGLRGQRLLDTTPGRVRYCIARLPADSCET